MAELQRLGEDEAGLGHGALGGVNEEYNSVHHLKYALHLAAEVGVARGIDNVYLRVSVLHGGVLRENGYPALALEVAGVHNSLRHGLVITENARLLEHLVDEGRLAVVDVGDYGNVSYLFLHSDHFH